MAILEIQIWDNAAADLATVDAGGVVRDRHDVRLSGGALWRTASAAWCAVDEDDPRTLADAEAAAIEEWSNGYDGDPRNIRAAVKWQE